MDITADFIADGEVSWIPALAAIFAHYFEIYSRTTLFPHDVFETVMENVRSSLTQNIIGKSKVYYKLVAHPRSFAVTQQFFWAI